MCTTLLLLGTLVMMLRRRFFNKVEPAPQPGQTLHLTAIITIIFINVWP
ncbi:PREDICTED: progressive rod-cone degeneration protein, partial [Cariama cristata]